MASASAKDDATQKLVDEAIEAIMEGRKTHTEEWAWGRAAQSRIRAKIAALEAAQRPPVSPEVREEVAEALLRVGGPRGGNGPDTNLVVVGYDDEQITYIVSEGKRRGHREWDRVLWQADALLARFSFPSQPVYDEEKIARWLAYVASDWTHNDCDDDDHPFGHTNWQAWLDEAAAFIAALRGGELTREETNE